MACTIIRLNGVVDAGMSDLWLLACPELDHELDAPCMQSTRLFSMLRACCRSGRNGSSVMKAGLQLTRATAKTPMLKIGMAMTTQLRNPVNQTPVKQVTMKHIAQMIDKSELQFHKACTSVNLLPYRP